MTTTFTPSLSVAQWLSLPLDVRLKLVEIFQIPRSEGAHVQIGGPESTFATSDGRSIKDISLITVEKMQSYLHSTESDFYKLLGILVGSIQGTLQESSEVQALRIKEGHLTKWSTLLTSMRLESKELGLYEEFNTLLKQLLPAETPNGTIPTEVSKPSKVNRGRAKSKGTESGREEDQVVREGDSVAVSTE